jgi:hypothetical protein
MYWYFIPTMHNCHDDLCTLLTLSQQNGHIQPLQGPSSSLLRPGVHSGSPKSESCYVQHVHMFFIVLHCSLSFF